MDRTHVAHRSAAAAVVLALVMVLSVLAPAAGASHAPADDGGEAAAAPTTIDSCGFDVTSSGTYVLAGNISWNASTDDCIDVFASDVVIDGQGNTITYGNATSNDDYGVDLGTSASNLTIRNLRLEASDGEEAILLDQDTDGVRVENVAVTGDYNGGVFSFSGNHSNWTIVGLRTDPAGEEHPLGLYADSFTGTLRIGDSVLTSQSEGVGLDATNFTDATVTVVNSTIVGRQWGGFEAYGTWNNVEFVARDSTFVQADEDGSYPRNFPLYFALRGSSAGNSFRVEDSTVNDTVAEIGVYFNATDSTTITLLNNDIRSADGTTDVGQGVRVGATGDLTMTARGNAISADGDAVYLGADADVEGIELHRNTLVGGEFGVENANASGVVNATNNYWGASDGPASPGTPLEDPVTGALANGTGSNVSEGGTPNVSNVHFDPFLTTGGSDFSVTIDSTNSPVTAGENVTVTATVTNVGTASDTQDVTLSIAGSQEDATTVTLGPDESTTVTLTWETAVTDGGNYTATVATANDTATTTVSVEMTFVGGFTTDSPCGDEPLGDNPGETDENC